MTLATSLRLADRPVSRFVGLMGQPPLTRDEAMVFRFPVVRSRRIHTWFVRAPIDVLWLQRERVTAIATLQPWTFGKTAPADTVIELPAGKAACVEIDDVVRLANRTSD